MSAACWCARVVQRTPVVVRVQGTSCARDRGRGGRAVRQGSARPADAQLRGRPPGRCPWHSPWPALAPGPAGARARPSAPGCARPGWPPPRPPWTPPASPAWHRRRPCRQTRRRRRVRRWRRRRRTSAGWAQRGGCIGGRAWLPAGHSKQAASARLWPRTPHRGRWRACDGFEALRGCDPAVGVCSCATKRAGTWQARGWGSKLAGRLHKRRRAQRLHERAGSNQGCDAARSRRGWTGGRRGYHAPPARLPPAGLPPRIPPAPALATSVPCSAADLKRRLQKGNACLGIIRSSI